MTPPKILEAAAAATPPVGWFVWIISHIPEINGLLQMAVLAATLVSTVLAAIYYWRKSR